MTDGLAQEESAPPGALARSWRFLLHNLFAIWGALMLLGGIGRLVMGDGRGFVGVGLGVAWLLLDGAGRFVKSSADRSRR